MNDDDGGVGSVEYAADDDTYDWDNVVVDDDDDENVFCCNC